MVGQLILPELRNYLGKMECPSGDFKEREWVARSEDPSGVISIVEGRVYCSVWTSGGKKDGMFTGIGLLVAPRVGELAPIGRAKLLR